MNNHIKIIVVSLIFIAASLVSALPNEQQSLALNNYFKYLSTYPKTLGPIGNAANGEIEIVQDEQKIIEIEKATGRNVGVVAEDKYWLWLNDAVKFPNNKYGVYGRIIWKCALADEGRPGAVVIAVLPDGKVALNRNYRHATRSWEYELPRGGRNSNESLEDTARREVKEETGMIIKELVLLGEVATDTGILGSIGIIFFARVIEKQNAAAEDSEAIASIDAFSIAELKQGFVDGYLVANVDKKQQKIPLRDPALAYALFMMDIKGLTF